MTIPRLILLALPVLISCGEEDATPVRVTPAVEKNALAADDTTPKLVEIATAGLRPPRRHAAGGPLRVSFGVRPGSSMTGSGSVEAAGAQTRIDVRLTGAPGGAHLEGSVRRGGCDSMGPRVAALNTVTVDSGGSGRAVTYAAVPIDSLGRSEHVLVFGRGGQPEVCAAMGGAVDGG